MMWVWVWLLATADARRTGLPGNPDDDGCVASELEEALEQETLADFVDGVAAACPGFAARITPWMRSRLTGERVPWTARACPRAKGDLKRAVSPGFDARMKGIAKACKLRGWPAEEAAGPSALLLGYVVAERMEEAGIEVALARRVGRRLAGIDGGRLDGRYGSFARRVDAHVLPVAERAVAPLPVDAAPLFTDGDADATEVLDGVEGWLAVLPPAGTLGEHAPIFGIGLSTPAPSSIGVTVSPTEVRIAYGAAGDVVQAGPDLDRALSEARERLSAAQEFGAEGLFHGSGPAGAHPDAADGLPDRVWVAPVEGATVQRVVMVLDTLFDDDGTPRFDAVAVASDGALVEWPERVD
jgi:hypothetical protein